MSLAMFTIKVPYTVFIDIRPIPTLHICSIASSLGTNVQYNTTLSPTLCRQTITNNVLVVKIILSPDEGIKEIPQLLSGSNPPVAVALGGAFDDVTVDSMRNAASTAGSVVWLRVDKSRIKEMPPMDNKDEFGAALAKRIKASLQEHKVGSGGEKDDIFLF